MSMVDAMSPYTGAPSFSPEIIKSKSLAAAGSYHRIPISLFCILYKNVHNPFSLVQFRNLFLCYQRSKIQ